MALLAGNLLAFIPLATAVAISTRSSEPIINVTAPFIALGTLFVVPATLFIERPLLRRLHARPRFPTSVEERVATGLLEELVVIALAGAALAIPGGIIFGFIGMFQNVDGYNSTFASYFTIGAVICGIAGIWCALLGRWAYEATRRSKAVTGVVIAVVAATVAWSLILFLRNFF